MTPRLATGRAHRLAAAIAVLGSCAGQPVLGRPPAHRDAVAAAPAAGPATADGPVLDPLAGDHRFLGAPLPASCRQTWTGCAVELSQRAWRDGYGVDDPALRRYVEGVVARVTRVSTLQRPPEVALGWFAAEAIGHQIEIGVDLIVRFDSEAELAGILAHEIAHLETRDDTGGASSTGPDDEAVADERAVVLLSRAGYPPGAVATALGRLGPDDPSDTQHPAMTERIRRTRALAVQLPAGGDDRRRALLAAIDGRAIDAPALAFSDGGAITSPQVIFYDAGPSVSGHPLDPDWMFVILRDRGIALGAPNIATPAPLGTWVVSAVGTAGAAEIRAALAGPRRRTLSVGTVTLGSLAPTGPGSLDRAIRAGLTHIAPLDGDATIAVIETPAGGVVATFDGPDGPALLDRWFEHLRPPTAAERAATAPRHLRLTTAPHAAALRDLVATCPDPTASAALDSGDRSLAAGEPFKCAVR